MLRIEFHPAPSKVFDVPGGHDSSRTANTPQTPALQRWEKSARAIKSGRVGRNTRHSALITISMLVAAVTCSAQQPPVALSPTAAVDHAIVTLRDLLPAATSPTLRQQAAAIALIRTPRAGATRVLSAAAIANQLPPDLRRQISLPPQITIHRFGWPIAPAIIQRAVLQYLKTLGANLGSPILAWDTEFTASMPQPVLQLVAVNWNQAQNALDFNLRCASRAECANFLVHASLTPDLAAKLRGTSAHAVANLLVERRIAAANIRPPSPILVSAGKAAMLTAEVDGLHITLPVVPLQRGVLGQNVRARDPITHKIFAAQVVGAGALRAVLN